MLARAVQNFANDLQAVSDAIKSRTVTQIKGALQKKAFDEAGIVIQSQVVSPPPQPAAPSQNSIVQNNTQINSTTTKQNTEVTLNALNAS